jgi:hypothetical protein
VAGRRRCPWFILDRMECEADVKSLTKSAHLKERGSAVPCQAESAVGCSTAHALPLPSIDRAWEITPDPFSKNALQVPPAAGHPINRISELMPWVYRSTHEAAALITPDTGRLRCGSRASV